MSNGTDTQIYCKTILSRKLKQFTRIISHVCGDVVCYQRRYILKKTCDMCGSEVAIVAQATGITTFLKELSRKGHSNIWRTIHKRCTAFWVPTHRHIQDIGCSCSCVKPLVIKRHRQKRFTSAKVLFPDKSKICFLFENPGPRGWMKIGNTQSKLLEVWCEDSTISDCLGNHVIWWP